MRDETILVWGAGAVGGVVAGYLARAGHNVALVDTDPAHVRSIRRDGLSVTGPEGRFTARPEASLPSDVTGRFKTVILAVKADRTGMAARDLAPALAEDGAVVSFQNGLCEVELADVLGPERVIGAFINFGADVVGPGQVAMGSRGSVVLGEIDGTIRPRTRTLLTIMQGFEPDARLSGNIWGYLWGKQAYSSVLKASGLSDRPMAEYLADPRWSGLNGALIRDVMAIARVQGIAVEGFDGFDPAAFETDSPEALSRAVLEIAAFWKKSAKTHSSTWRDLGVFRQRTDAAAQLGPVIAAGQRAGIPTSRLARLLDLIAEIEDGRSRQGDRMLERLGQVRP